MIRNSDLVNRVIRCLFSDEEARLVADTIENRCAESIPFHSGTNPDSFDRLRLSILRVTSEKAIRIDTKKQPLETMEDRLRSAVEQANVDWRDLLVNAGFGNDVKEHLKWAYDMLEKFA